MSTHNEEDNTASPVRTGPQVQGRAEAPTRPILRIRGRPRKPQVNPDALVIETEPTPPHLGVRPSQSKWIPCLQKMKFNESVFVPDTTPSKLGYVRRLGRSIDIELFFEPEGTGVRIFRVDPDEEASPDPPGGPSNSEDGL